MSGSRGKGKRFAKKQELVKRIQPLKTMSELESARGNLFGRRAEVRVLFYLWEGDEKHTNTSSKKDLDNLKLVLDVLF